MEKEYSLLSGEKLFLNEISEEEKVLLDEVKRLAKKDPNGKRNGNFYLVWVLVHGHKSIFSKIKVKLNPRLSGSSSYRVARDMLHRIGIKQGITQ